MTNLSFCMGSSLTTVKLDYLDKEDRSHSIEFPTTNINQLQHLNDACNVAKFGRQTETVLDESYRRAMQLTNDRFSTSFDLHDWGIIKEIENTLFDKQCKVRAELYTLNVYKTGDFFKNHQDTPRSTDMFGTLVVCFPTEFNGGDLVLKAPTAKTSPTKYQDYDHSDSELDEETYETLVVFRGDAKKTTWIAFFSDIHHHVKPVTDGFRVTITFTLYYDETNKPAFNPPKTTIPQEIRDFMHKNREKGNKAIAVPLEHNYPIEFEKPMSEIIPYLRGNDKLTYETLVANGHNTDVVAVWKETIDLYRLKPITFDKFRYKYLKRGPINTSQWREFKDLPYDVRIECYASTSPCTLHKMIRNVPFVESDLRDDPAFLERYVRSYKPLCTCLICDDVGYMRWLDKGQPMRALKGLVDIEKCFLKRKFLSSADCVDEYSPDDADEGGPVTGYFISNSVLRLNLSDGKYLITDCDSVAENLQGQGARMVMDVGWMNFPTKYQTRNSCIAWGNDCSKLHVYSYGAMLVEL